MPGLDAALRACREEVLSDACRAQLVAYPCIAGKRVAATEVQLATMTVEMRAADSVRVSTLRREAIELASAAPEYQPCILLLLRMPRGAPAGAKLLPETARKLGESLIALAKAMQSDDD